MTSQHVALVFAHPTRLEEAINARIAELTGRVDAIVTVNPVAISVAVVRYDYLVALIPYLVEPLPEG